jgi:hypothetical protein
VPKYLVEMHDGRKFQVEADHPPSEADVMAALGQSPAASHDAAPPMPSAIEQTLADNPNDPWQTRAGKFLMRQAKEHPVQAGAMLGGLVAAPMTGGASIPAAMAAAGLGAAGGAGLGSIANAAMGGENGPKTAGDVAKTMATEGALGAAGEGLGQGAARIASVGGKLVYKTALRPSMALQRDFGDIAATGLREGTPVSQSGAHQTMETIGGLGQQTRDALAARDAVRPAVRGYLPPAQGVELGAAPIHPTMPNLRDPRSAGVLLRDAPQTAGPVSTAAHGSMIAPAEIAQRGLAPVRAELSDRALAGDATDQLAALQERFLSQRPTPLTLTEAQRLKQAEQALADSAYRAEQMGNPVNGVDPQFHQGVARGAREAIEQRAPEVIPLNKRTQGLIGLSRAIEDATRRNVPGVGSLRTFLGDFAPNAASRVGIAADRLGTSGTLPPSLKAALIAALGGDQ